MILLRVLLYMWLVAVRPSYRHSYFALHTVSTPTPPPLPIRRRLRTLPPSSTSLRCTPSAPPPPPYRLCILPCRFFLLKVHASPRLSLRRRIHTLSLSYLTAFSRMFFPSPVPRPLPPSPVRRRIHISPLCSRCVTPWTMSRP